MNNELFEFSGSFIDDKKWLHIEHTMKRNNHRETYKHYLSLNKFFYV